MTNLTAIEQNGTLVVDYRLIADDLGIQHKNLLATIDKYLDEIEEDWGAIQIETREFKTSQGNTSKERIAYLNEQQSQLLMTYSRNTDRVRQCKRKLVKAFDSAKKVFASQSSRIRELEVQLELAKTQERLSENQLKLVAVVQLLETVSPGLAPLALGKADSVVERIEYIERTITPNATYEGFGIGYIRKKYGFKNDAQAWAWLETIDYGKNSGKWKLQLSAVEHHKLTPEHLRIIAEKFSKHEGDRQLFLGE